MKMNVKIENMAYNIWLIENSVTYSIKINNQG